MHPTCAHSPWNSTHGSDNQPDNIISQILPRDCFLGNQRGSQKWVVEYRNKPHADVWHFHCFPEKSGDVVSVQCKGGAHCECAALVALRFTLVPAESLMWVSKIGLHHLGCRWCVSSVPRLCSRTDLAVEALQPEGKHLWSLVSSCWFYYSFVLTF